MSESLTLAPTADPRVFVDPAGRRLSPPPTWDCLPPGDAGLTRRVKQAGPSWVVIEKRGRRSDLPHAPHGCSLCTAVAREQRSAL